MADTKQAAAETVCEHCGERVVYLYDFGWMHCDTHGTPDHYAAPRTQPSQELRIPDDLKKRYEYCMDTKGLYDFPNGLVAELIERIARLEGGR